MLYLAPGVRNLFVVAYREYFTAGTVFQVPADGQHIFKILEIELGLMYDNLYTKARVVRTWLGAVLRCLTHISLVVAFVLFLVRVCVCVLSSLPWCVLRETTRES